MPKQETEKEKMNNKWNQKESQKVDSVLLAFLPLKMLRPYEQNQPFGTGEKVWIRKMVEPPCQAAKYFEQTAKQTRSLKFATFIFQW